MITCKCSLLAALVSLLVVASSAQQLFHSGSRYGKRAETSLGNAHEDRRGLGTAGGQRHGRHSFADVQVAPRTDRFYTGSRYGKRAERADVRTDDRMSSVLSTSDDDPRVTCLYTGVTNLYRCFDRKDNASEETAAVLSN